MITPTLTFPLQMSDSLITRLPGTASLGPLCYFSGRLVWVQDSSRAVVSDLHGRYTAQLLSRVRVIAVRDPTLHQDSGEIILFIRYLLSLFLFLYLSLSMRSLGWCRSTYSDGILPSCYRGSLPQEILRRTSVVVRTSWLLFGNSLSLFLLLSFS